MLVARQVIRFTAHNRRDEVRLELRQGGFQIVREYFTTYGIDTRNPWQWLKYAPAFLFKGWAGLILVHARK